MRGLRRYESATKDKQYQYSRESVNMVSILPKVAYKTKEGTAQEGKDFEAAADTASFQTVQSGKTCPAPGGFQLSECMLK